MREYLEKSSVPFRCARATLDNRRSEYLSTVDDVLIPIWCFSSIDSRPQEQWGDYSNMNILTVAKLNSVDGQ